MKLKYFDRSDDLCKPSVDLCNHYDDVCNHYDDVCKSSDDLCNHYDDVCKPSVDCCCILKIQQSMNSLQLEAVSIQGNDTHPVTKLLFERVKNDCGKSFIKKSGFPPNSDLLNLFVKLLYLILWHKLRIKYV